VKSSGNQEIAREHLEIAQDGLKSFLNGELPDCERILLSGEAAQEIAETAKNGGFDLIVTPTHAWPVPADARRLNDGQGAERCGVPGDDYRACGGGGPAAIRAPDVGLRDRAERRFGARVRRCEFGCRGALIFVGTLRMHTTRHSAGWRICCKLWDARCRSRWHPGG